MNNDNTGDAYNRITGFGFAYELPECFHPVRYITEEWNKDLKKYAFIFGLHVMPDNDSCIKFDRKRTEIKTSNTSLYFTHIDKIFNEKTSIIDI
jgi:hypothetical protein